MSGKGKDKDDYGWLYDARKQPRSPVGEHRSAVRHRLLQFAAVIAGLALLSYGARAGYEYVSSDHTAVPTQSPSVQASPHHKTVASSTPTTQPATATPSPRRTAAECIADLPLSFKLGQKIMISATAETVAQAASVAARYHVGGIILMDQVSATAVDSLQRRQALPMLVATDQEGGIVQRYKSEGLLPAAADVPARLTPSQYQARIAQDDRYLRQQGITMNLAPVADVAPVSGTSVLGGRIYSSDPTVVSEYVRADVAAGLSSGILPTLKHFPGLGSATGNTDYGPATTPSWSTFQSRDLVPYRQLAGESVAVMVGNQTVPGLTDGLPASLSRAAITDELRDGLGYKNNVVITDALNAKAITSRHSISRAAVMSWQAGSDIALVVGTTPGESLNTQVANIISLGQQAVQGGQLSGNEINASVGRLFALPQKQADACQLVDSLR